MDRRTYSHRDYGGQICIYIDNFDLHIFQSKIDFVIFEKNVRFKFSQQPRHLFLHTNGWIMLK